MAKRNDAPEVGIKELSNEAEPILHSTEKAQSNRLNPAAIILSSLA